MTLPYGSTVSKRDGPTRGWSWSGSANRRYRRDCSGVRSCPAYAVHDVGWTGSGDDSNVSPSAARDVLRTHDVPSEAHSFAVVVSVILDGDQHVLPAQIEEIARIAEVIEDGYLRLRPRKSGANENQSQPGLARRLRACVVEAESRPQMRDARRATVPAGQPATAIRSKRVTLPSASR